MTVDFDVGTGLNNVDAVEHVQEALAFYWHRELLIEHIHKDVGGTVVGSSNGKVIDLRFEDDSLAVDKARV